MKTKLGNTHQTLALVFNGMSVTFFRLKMSLPLLLFSVESESSVAITPIIPFVSYDSRYFWQ